MKFLFIFLNLFVSTLLFSQAPEGINYQAVMRNNSGNLVTNSTVAIRVQIRQGSATGSAVYQERQSITCTSQGLINMVIGAGTPQVGTFNNINWAVGPFFVNLAVDFSNGVNYQDFGTQQLMSVPYALYAKTSGVQLNQWRYGNTIPANSFGVLGDFYLDVVTGNVYYKNSATTWVLTGNIKGPVGPSGAVGAQGVQGIQGVQGAQGTQGVAGVNGSNGQNTLVKTTTETAGANCTTGGVKIEYGLDANSNGTLDVSEINATLTRFVCNGATGAQGVQGLTGAQGIQGVAGSTGAAGAAGKNSLAKTTTEAAGVNCTTGGVKIEYGLDANSNGTLDVSEVNASLTKYVCNGAVGATGAQGIQGLTGAQGIQGITGSTGAAGAAGKNTLVKTTTEAAGVNCTTGGVKIEYGLDANSNGTLDVSEINATLTRYVCNGATGAQGIQGLTGAQGIQGVAGTNGTNGTNGVDGKNTLAKTTTEAAGANCTTGGVKIEYGLDANNNGTLDVSEINATLTRYVCNGATGATGAAGTNGAQGIQGVAGSTGAAGAAGKNTLAKTTTEAAGANCTTGGVKIEYGLDANNNGTLDVSEINASLTKYVCNGAVGATGQQGPQGIQGLTGAQGIQGVAGTNGTNGADGKNTLAKTTTEAAGANCTTGGVKIEYGLDANSNGTLDVSEINAALTRYVCNGATGAQGIQGLTGAQGIQGAAGAAGTNGAQGIQGVAGTNGTDGKNTLAKTTTEAVGANCTTGGVKIEYGLDANSNGTLDISEINATLTKYVCNGATGAQGIQGLTGSQGIQGAAGAAGTNGAQGIQGVAGTNGTDGKNTLAKTTTEAAGANCTTGGVKIEYGLDANSNGTLDVSEINATLTKYVCNGATGAQGIQGVAGTNGTNGTDGKNTLAKTTTEAAGANCTTGGVKIEYGLDANSNGTLDVSEINATLSRYVCNGATGAQGIQGAAGTNGTNGAQGIQGVAGTNGTDGKNTLAKTTTEAAGANCTTGGVKIEYGLDANSNGTLDVSEINATLTKYVCNGATGAQGIQGVAGVPGTNGTNGAQGIQGVAGTNGTNGTDGKNTLAKTTTEAAGANCTTGGVKIEYGLDANNNGTLDVSEINATLTKYVCNGIQGTPGDLNAWGLQGNSGTVDGVSFIGTTDNMALNFRVNNLNSGKIDHLNDNVFFGYNSGNNSMTGGTNVAYGNFSLFKNTSGYDNIAIGRGALFSNTTGYHNFAFGRSSLYNNLTGSTNTAIGTYTLENNTISWGNTAIGYGVLRYSDASNNTGIGVSALQSNTTGSSNTGVGNCALHDNTVGVDNTGLGNAALYYNISGSYNSCIGTLSMYNNTSGICNTSIGYRSFNTGTNQYNNSTALGYYSDITASNQVRIGNSSVTSIGGQVGWSTLSDGRLKLIKGKFDLGLDFILKLNPVTYTYKNSTNQNEYNGLIAQEVDSTLKKLNTNFSGLNKPENSLDYYSIRYGDFVLPLINSVKELNEKNDILEERILHLERKLTELENKIK